MRPFERFEEPVAGDIKPRALGAVVDRDLALEDIGEQRDLVDVPAGLTAGRDGNDRGRYMRRLGRGIGDRLSDDRLVSGKDRGQERLILIGGLAGSSSPLRIRWNGDQDEAEKRGHANSTQLEHTELPNTNRRGPMAAIAAQASPVTVNRRLTAKDFFSPLAMGFGGDTEPDSKSKIAGTAPPVNAPRTSE